jgi:hypothetical protein
MYGAWQKASEKPRYILFKPALLAAMTKLDEYYQRTAVSDAHIIAMGMSRIQFVLFQSDILPKHLVLDPRKKFEHFTKNWDDILQAEVKDLVQKKVRVVVVTFLLHANGSI